MDTPTLTFWASVATLAALFIALVQLAIAWREREEASKQTEKLRQISDSLSTQYIGALPDYYPHVIDLIEGAQKSITVLCDYPAYGCYTNMANWLVYHDRLRDKSLKGVALTLICPNARQRSANDRGRYFAAANDNWEKWVGVEENRKHVHEFVRYVSKVDKDISSMKFADQPEKHKFFEILQRADEAMLRDCFADGDRVEQIDAWTPIDFWLVDSKRAVFAFSNYDLGMSRYGFSTTDPTLISAFQAVVDNYRW